MVDFLRKQLDELMGADRNEKFEIETCPYNHSLPARTAYEEASKLMDYGYEDLLERKIKTILRECDRRIDQGRRRVEELEKEKIRNNPYDAEINSLSQRLEAQLEEGNLDEANKIEAELEVLKTKRAELKQQSANAVESEIQVSTHPQYQALKVCEYCGLLLSAKDTSNLEDHYQGKQHIAFVAIREKLADLEKRNSALPRAPEYEYEMPDPFRDYGRDHRNRDRSRDSRDFRGRGRSDRFPGRPSHFREQGHFREQTGPYYRDRDGERDSGRDRDGYYRRYDEPDRNPPPTYKDASYH